MKIFLQMTLILLLAGCATLEPDKDEKKAVVECEAYAGGVRLLCRSTVAKRARYLVRFEDSGGDPPSETQYAQQTQAIAKEIGQMKVVPRWICQQRFNGLTTCAKTGTALAMYDAEYAKEFGIAISAVAIAGGISSEAAAVFRCRNGTWSSESDESYTQSAFAAVVSRRCMELEGLGLDLLDKNGLGGIGAGGIPLDVEGFEPFANMCLNVDLENVNEVLDDAWLSVARNCYASADATTTPGSGPAPAPIEGGPDPDADVDDQKTTCDSSGCTTTGTMSDGTTFIIQTKTSDNTTIIHTETPNSDTGGHDNHTYLTDSNGEVISHTSDHYDSNGNLDQHNSYDSDGNIESYEVHNADGSYTEYRGDGQEGYTIDTRGDRSFEVCVLPGICSQHKITREKWERVFGLRRSNQLCDQDGCVSPECQAAANSYFRAESICADSGGAAAECQAYTSAFSCCTQQSTGNPLITYPNPEGEYVCDTGDVDLNQEYCEKMCSVAGGGIDCVRECGRQFPTERPGLDVILQICLYAYSEDCFQSDVDIFDVLGPNPPFPYPTPPYATGRLDSHLSLGWQELSEIR